MIKIIASCSPSIYFYIQWGENVVYRSGTLVKLVTYDIRKVFLHLYFIFNKYCMCFSLSLSLCTLNVRLIDWLNFLASMFWSRQYEHPYWPTLLIQLYSSYFTRLLFSSTSTSSLQRVQTGRTERRTLVVGRNHSGLFAAARPRRGLLIPMGGADEVWLRGREDSVQKSGVSPALDPAEHAADGRTDSPVSALSVSHIRSRRGPWRDSSFEPVPSKS